MTLHELMKGCYFDNKKRINTVALAVIMNDMSDNPKVSKQDCAYFYGLLKKYAEDIKKKNEVIPYSVHFINAIMSIKELPYLQSALFVKEDCILGNYNEIYFSDISEKNVFDSEICSWNSSTLSDEIIAACILNDLSESVHSEEEIPEKEIIKVYRAVSRRVHMDHSLLKIHEEEQEEYNQNVQYCLGFPEIVSSEELEMIFDSHAF